MKYLGVLLLIGFVGLAVFGIFSMNYTNGHDHDGCMAATAQGVDCPKEANLIDFVAFHFDAFRGFSLATFSESIMSTLLLAFASLLLFSLAFFSPHLFKPPQLAFNKYRFRDSFSPPQKQELIHWLALHENSPAIF